jgi:hypothetical protein
LGGRREERSGGGEGRTGLKRRGEDMSGLLGSALCCILVSQPHGAISSVLMFACVELV